MTSSPFWLMIASTRHGRLARLAVADDQLALAPTDRHHRVNGFEASLQGLLDRLSVDDARGDLLDWGLLAAGNRALSVDWLTERVHDAPQHLVTDRHRNNPARSFDGVALLDRRRLAQEDRTNARFLEVQGDAEDAVWKLQHLGGHRTFNPMDACNAIAHGHDRADLGNVNVQGVITELVFDDLRDFVCFDAHGS